MEDMTVQQLKAKSVGGRILVAVKGRVFDVTEKGQQFYAPGNHSLVPYMYLPRILPFSPILLSLTPALFHHPGVFIPLLFDSLAALPHVVVPARRAGLYLIVA